MDYRATLLLVAALTGLAPPVSLAQEAIAMLKDRELQESLTREASVSGRVVAGVLSADASADDSLFLFSSPARASGDVCVRVISRDGLYWSENTFRWPSNSQSEVVRLQYQSRYDLNSYRKLDLAVLGYEGDCSEVREGPVLIALRGKDHALPESLDILVNSGRSDTFAVLTNLSAGPRTVACRPITDGRRTGYDTICRVPVADSGSENLVVKILRRRFDRMLSPTELVLRLPNEPGR